MSGTIEKRQSKNKQALLEYLRKTPIVQIACQKLGMARATYYRWRQSDTEFANMADKAIEEGSSLINDLAESQLISAIKEQNLGAIIFWLKSHHSAYATRVEITSTNKVIENLSPEQEAVVKKALELASLIPEKDGNKNEQQ